MCRRESRDGRHRTEARLREPIERYVDVDTDAAGPANHRKIDAGVKLAIGSDAYVPEHFSFIPLAVLTARQGGAAKEDVLNAASGRGIRASWALERPGVASFLCFLELGKETLGRSRKWLKEGGSSCRNSRHPSQDWRPTGS